MKETEEENQRVADEEKRLKEIEEEKQRVADIKGERGTEELTDHDPQTENKNSKVPQTGKNFKNSNPNSASAWIP